MVDNCELDVVPSYATGSDFESRIALLVHTGADRFDPIRFRFIESMAQRASQQRPSVRAIVQKKIDAEIDQYINDFETVKATALETIARIEAEFPSSADTAIRLLNSCNFREILKLESHLRRPKSDPQKGAKSFAALTAELDGDDNLIPESGRNTSGHSLDDLLLQQESEVYNLFSNEKCALDPTIKPTKGKELKSAKLYRTSLAKRNAHKLVTKIIDNAPENPGPLNPQTLVTRSLSTMRELSPEYLNRFVAYANTLLWLEQAGKSIEPVKAKKKRAEK